MANVFPALDHKTTKPRYGKPLRSFILQSSPISIYCGLASDPLLAKRSKLKRVDAKMSQIADQNSPVATNTVRNTLVAELLIELFKENSAAEEQMLNEYFPRLTRLATKLMNGFPSACEDGEDVAQSTLKSFFRQIRAGRVFEVSSHNALWALLAEMASHKAMNRIRKERAVKRGGGKVINEVDMRCDATNASPLDSEPKSIHPEDFDLACEELLQVLPNDELKRIAIFLFRGLSQREIAEQLGRVSANAIQRKVDLIRALWREFLAAAEKQ